MKKHADGTPAFDLDPLGSTGALLIDPSVDALAGTAPSAAPRQIVFIEGSVADYQILANGVKPGVKVVILNPDANGVQQIADYLQQHHVRNLDAVSIVADGADGELQLGSTLLNAGNVASYQPQLAEIGAALKPGGDLLIYGCDVAQNSAGVVFLGDLAAATGVANIAAAAHVVGAAAQGGSFNLDVDLGAAATATGPFTAATVAAYPDLLPITTAPALVWYLTESSTTSNTGVFTINVNGGAPATNPTDVKSTPAFTGFVTVDGLAIDPADGHYFVANFLASGTNQIIEGNTNGTGTPSVIYTSGNSGQDAIVGLAFDQVNELIYMAVTDVNVGTSGADTGIYTINALGTGTRTASELVNLSSGVQAPNDVAIDTTHNLLFYTQGFPGLTDAEEVGVANLTTGAVINGDLVNYQGSNGGDLQPYGIAVNPASDTLYWTTVNDAANAGNAIFSATYTTGASVTLSNTQTLATTSDAQAPIGIGLDVPAGGYYVDTLNGFGSGVTNESNEVLWGGSLTSPVTLTNVYSIPEVNGGNEFLPAEAIVVETLPTVTASGTVTFAVGGSAVTVDPGATVPANADGYDLASATVSIAGGLGTGDTLSFTNQLGITGSFSSGTLTLSGVATEANYQTALDSVRFSTTSTSTTSRTLDWTVSDGVVSSATTTSTVAVIVPPVIDGITPDTGISSTDGITDTGALTIDGTAEPGSAIAVFNGGTQIGSGATTGGAWAVVLGTPLAPGNYTLTATATLSGVTSSLSSGFAVDVDETAPTVTSDNRVGGTPNNAGSDQFTVVFSEAVFGVSASSFALAETGNIAGSIGSVSGSGTTYTVTVNSVTGDGTLGLNLKAAGSNGIEDTAGNVPAAYTSGQTYTIEHTPPSVTSIDTVGSSPNNASSDQFSVVFSDSLGAVTGVSTSSFALAETGTVGGTINSVSGSGDSYTVTVTGVTGDGTLGLNLKSSGTGISDAAGNSPTAGFTGQTYTIEHTPPSVTAIDTVQPSSNSGGTEQFTVDFSESVTGVTTSDFTLADTGSVTGTISSISGSGNSYTVTVTGATGTGTMGLDLKSSGTGITDAAGNAISGGFTGGETYTISPASATFDAHVYTDTNGDGVQDGSEAGLAGVTVNLLNGSGNPTGQSLTTDSNGNVSFTGLTPGSYEVAVVTPTGDVVSQAVNLLTPNTLTGGHTANATEGVYAPPALAEATLDLTVGEGMSLGNLWSELIANGVDPNPSSLKITAVNTSGTQGFVALNTGTQSLTYIATGLNPSAPVDAFTYTLTDGSGGSVTGTVDVTVTGPNLPTTVATAPGSTTTATGAGQRLISEGSGQTLVGSSAGGDQLFGGANTTISALGSGNTIFVTPGNHVIAMGVNNNTATLYDGNNSVSATGTGNTVTGGNGNDVVSGMTGSSTITLGNGNDTVTVSGANNKITVGTGTDHVTAGNGGNETVVAGDGTNTISAGGSGDSITVGNGKNTIAATGADATIVAGNGGDTIVGTGAGDNITSGGGNDTIQVTVGAATIKAGLGTDTIKFAGSDSLIVNQGGTDTLTDTGTNNTIVLPLAGQGLDTINGSVLSNGDTFDLRSALAATTWDQQLSDLGNYLTLGTSGSNTLVQISSISGGTPITVAVLDGEGSVSLSTFVAHSLLT